MWPTIKPFLLETKPRKIGENIREITWMSNREEGTCAGRYDADKVGDTLHNTYVVRSAENRERARAHPRYTTVVTEEMRRLNKHL